MLKYLFNNSFNLSSTAAGKTFYTPTLSPAAENFNKAMLIIPTTWPFVQAWITSLQNKTRRVANSILYIRDDDYADAAAFNAKMNGGAMFYELASPVSFTSLFLSASSTADELTAMPADAIPLSEIQFADNNWSIEEAIYDAPEADANGVITPTAVTGQMRIQYSLDAAEQIDTLQKEYAALEARVTALENA